jgi:hypothetical protein
LLSFDELAPLLGNREVADAPCPGCSAERQPSHRRLPVLRIWRVDQGMLSYYCAHCEASGYVKADDDPRPSSKTLQLARQMKREEHEAEAERHRIGRALDLWRESVPLHGTWAEAYLSDRGLVAGNARGLRCHPRCPFPDGQKAPALIAAFTSLDALVDRDPFEEIEPCGIHRIRGRGHENKFMLGRVRRAAVMLDPPHEIASELGVCEGIETALAVRRWRGGPVWALGSAGAMERFPIIRRVQRLTVWADNDESNVGQAAGMTLGRRYQESGRHAVVRWPGKRGDYASVRG